MNISCVSPLISYAVVIVDQSNQSNSDTMLSAQGCCAGCGAQHRRVGLGVVVMMVTAASPSHY